MPRKQIQKLLSAFLEPYLKYGSETLFLCLDADHLRVHTPGEMTDGDIVIRKFTKDDLKLGLSARSWRHLIKEIESLVERFPKCLD